MISTLQPVPGFKHFTTHHCVTGSLRHIYAFNGYAISEEMLLGLGAGVGFIYWQTKNSLPFLGGRVNIERPGEEGLEKTVGCRTGVVVRSFQTGSAGKAEKVLLAELSAGRPVMLRVDMGFLPYFDFGGQEYHFGYHVVVACGYEPETGQVLLADREAKLHPVSLESLRQARGSTFPPFSPRHAWYEFDFHLSRLPEASEIREAILACARGMLLAPISNLGIRGIHKAAQRVRSWPQEMDEDRLRGACMNTYIMIDARGGTGGGLFRCIYGRFLEEAAVLCADAELGVISKGMQAAGDCWQQAARLFEQASHSSSPASELESVSCLLSEIAGQEQSLWRRLESL